MTLRAGIDLDGCVYRWSDTARFLLNWNFGLALGESTSWDYLQQNTTPDQWRWLWREGVEQHGLFRHGNCYPGAFEALTDLARDHELVFITARPPNARADTLDWLAYHRLPAREVHIIGASERKSEATRRCDWYVDDRPENVVDLDRTGARTFLFDRPWNQGAPHRRVTTWAQLVKEVRG